MSDGRKLRGGQARRRVLRDPLVTQTASQPLRSGRRFDPPGPKPVSASGIGRPASSTVATVGAACHAEGRGFESHQPLPVVPPITRTTCAPSVLTTAGEPPPRRARKIVIGALVTSPSESKAKLPMMPRSARAAAARQRPRHGCRPSRRSRRAGAPPPAPRRPIRSTRAASPACAANSATKWRPSAGRPSGRRPERVT